MDADVVVVGAGPAGLLASWAAARAGARVRLLEKAGKPGVKILISGGTRCNVANVAERDETARRFNPEAARRFLRAPLRHFFRDELLGLLADRGVPTHLEPTGKFFPDSDRASDVCRALVALVAEAGVQPECRRCLTGLEPDGDGWRLTLADGQTLRARAVVLATGGRSYPKVGTTGDGYPLLARLGHTITVTRPGLVGLHLDAPWLTALSGVRVAPARVRLLSESGKRLAAREGDLLVTHRGLSGPAPMDLSSCISAWPARLELDWLPARDEDALRAELLGLADSHGKRQLAGTLARWLPSRLAAALQQHAQVPPDRKLAVLSKAERKRLLAALKRLPLTATGTRGYDHAEVTCGGVALSEIDPRTMASRRVPGLFVAGELLDLDGPIGGFNFQAAFSTGALAGAQAASYASP